MYQRLWAKLLTVCFILILAPALQATTLDVALDIQGPGLSTASGGVGLQGIGSGTRNLSVQIGGPVQAALLYWVGRDRPCPQSGGVCVVPSQPYKDQVLRFDGSTITGTIIGTEGQPVSAGGPINNIGFLADVTSIVQARGTGLQTFSIADGDTSSNLFHLNGAGLLVIYTDTADPNVYRLIVVDGLDFAYGADPTPGPTRVTVPVTFDHGTSAAPRQGAITVFTGDAQPMLGLLRLQLPQTPPPPPQETGDEGCTPGYWKNHTDSWGPAGLSPGQTTGSVFSSASAFPSLASQSLLQSLQGGGGSGTLGAAKILLRAAVAALLNASHPNVDYPRTTSNIIADVNSALASNNRTTMLALAGALDDHNNGGCPLN